MKVIEKIVFGGDVLINEKDYSVQLVMMNVECDFNGLVGVVYRFEGYFLLVVIVFCLVLLLVDQMMIFIWNIFFF